MAVVEPPLKAGPITVIEEKTSKSQKHTLTVFMNIISVFSSIIF